MNHPSQDLLIQLAAGVETDIGEHVEECDLCSRKVGEISALISGHDREHPGQSDSPRATERDAAHQTISKLQAVSDQNLRERLMSARELRTPGGIDELLDWLPGVRWSRPERALIAANVVVDLLDELPGDSPNLLAQLRVGALRELASALRALGRYDQALEVLREAETHAETLPISELELARIQYERGRTHLELGECEEARLWASKATDGFRRFGDQRRVNRAAYMIAASYFNEGNMDASAEAFLKVLALAEGGDETTTACTRSALGHVYVRTGRASEAVPLFRKAIATYRERGMFVDVLKSEWGLARVLIAESDYERAIETLRGLARQFQDLKLIEEASLVRLDLYEALLIVERLDEAEAEVRSSLDVLSGRFSRREQQRAVAYLREVVELREPRPEWVREVSDFLDLSRANPQLTFEAPAGSN